MKAARSTSRVWALALVLAASVAFRWPAIVNAAETNSDAAVVGLQAMHMLHGEHSWFLWGSGYQTSIDSAYAAVVFGVFGASPRALLMSSLSLHLALTALAWSTIARRIDPWRAAIAVWPLVLTSSPLQTYVLYPPREASLAIMMAALWALDRAADARARALAVGGALIGVACFADPYALVLAPAVGAFGAACAIDRANMRETGRRILAFAAGVLLGMMPFIVLRSSARATGGQLALSGSLIAHNARLLADGLAWTVGARAWSANDAMTYAPWGGPAIVRVVAFIGGVLFVVAIACGGACAFLKRFPWSVRRLAVVGGLALPVTIAGFLASPMVMDLFSSRYLAAIPLLAPFALAPIAHSLRARTFALAMAPCAFACGLAGWVGYGPFLRNTHGPPSDEMALEHALAASGVRMAMADYWVAYRTTFLTNERLVVVPTNAAEDRYAPYRADFDASPIVAYVFDPMRSRESSTLMRDRVRAGETPFARDYSIVHAGKLSAIVLRRE
jgi:hypothetical protein